LEYKKNSVQEDGFFFKLVAKGLKGNAAIQSAT